MTDSDQLIRPTVVSRSLQQQGLLILDGGLATELERRGADLRHELWSARMLIEDPALIREVHLDFLRAGADIIATASYQASTAGFESAGLDTQTSERAMLSSVDLACQAREAFLSEPPARDRLQPLIAASIGPYGACLADGSEYRGDYSLDKVALMDFHRPRMALLAETQADLFAFETIPSLLEAEALMSLLDEFEGREAWLSFSCKDERHVSHGEPFAECVVLAEDHPQIVAVGVNCTNPAFIPELLRSATSSRLPLVAYPNSGEDWDAARYRWAGKGTEKLDAAAWVQAGARLVGGCCRVGPEQISAMRQTLLGSQA